MTVAEASMSKAERPVTDRRVSLSHLA